MEQYNGEPGALRGACPVLREDCANLPPKGGKAALSYSTPFPTLLSNRITGNNIFTASAESETKEECRLSAKLDRIGADLEKARKKRAEWDAKVKDLERRYREEENSEIHEMVHAANLNPEQLSELLRMFAADMAPKPDTINTMNEEETQNEI